MGSLLGTHPSALGLLFFPVPNTQSQKILRNSVQLACVTSVSVCRCASVRVKETQAEMLDTQATVQILSSF